VAVVSHLGRLAQHFQDMASALRPCIQEEPAVVRQRHFPGRDKTITY
jgi:hypothetical protein